MPVPVDSITAAALAAEADRTGADPASFDITRVLTAYDVPASVAGLV